MSVARKVSALILGLLVHAMTWSENFVIGVEEIDYFPYYHIDKGKDYRGFAREYFDALGKRYGHQFSYRPLPIKRLYRELAVGKIDFKFPDNPNWAKDEKQGSNVLYSEPVVGYIDGVLILPAQLDAATKPFNSVGYVRGFSPWTLMELINSGTVQSRELNSLSSLIQLTLDKRIDGAYFNLAVANHLLKTKFGDSPGLVFATHLPHDKTNYRVSALASQSILEEMNAFSSTKEATALRKKYGLELY